MYGVIFGLPVIAVVDIVDERFQFSGILGLFAKVDDIYRDVVLFEFLR